MAHGQTAASLLTLPPESKGTTVNTADNLLKAMFYLSPARGKVRIR